MHGAALMTRDSQIEPGAEVPVWVDRVRRLMGERGWSGRELARRLGLSSAWVTLTIVQGERGAQPRRDTLVKLAQVFDEPVALWLRLGGFAADPDELMSTRPSFLSFVDSEPTLTDDQKRMMRDLYSSWVPQARKQTGEVRHVRRRAKDDPSR